MSYDSVRRLFENEPGVLFPRPSGRGKGKRDYRLMLIPESVLERVYLRLVNQSREEQGLWAPRIHQRPRVRPRLVENPVPNQSERDPVNASAGGGNARS